MGVTAAEGLLLDRFADFQCLARTKGGLPPLPAAAAEAPATSATRQDPASDARLPVLLGRLGDKAIMRSADKADKVEAKGSGGASFTKKSGFLREFFDAVGEIQCTLRQGRSSLEDLNALHNDLLQVTTRERQAAISDKLARASDEVLGHAGRAKQQLEALKEASSAVERAGLVPESAECKIRASMQQTMVKKHQQLLLDFQRMQVNLKETLERREAQDLRILCPLATEADVQRMIQDGESSAQVFMTKVAGSHALVYDELARIRSKHQEILRLEQSVQDLSEMFREVALLVDTQGELLDSIEVHVENSKDYMEKGEKELVTARKVQKNTLKWQCRITTFMAVLTTVIVGPLLLR